MGQASGDRFPQGDSRTAGLKGLLHSLGDASVETMRAVAERIIAATRLPIRIVILEGKPALQDIETGQVVSLRELLLRALARSQN